MNGHLKRNIMDIRNPARLMENGNGVAAEGVPKNRLRDGSILELRHVAFGS
jgi:hypothetical protein